MFELSFKTFLLALKQKANIYHFHDPELLLVGLLLKFFTGKKIIYDVHEDYEHKIPSREWVRKEFRRPIAICFGILEKLSSNIFDYIITADAYTKMKFKNRKVEVLANLASLNFAIGLKRYEKKGAFKIIYVGGISKDRGAYMMVEAMKYLKHENIELHLLGRVINKELINLFKSSQRIKYHGYTSLKKVSMHLINSDVGLLLLQPVSAYLYYPGENVVKLFEYMITGLPVIYSDFPKLKSLISKVGNGICVDPTDPVRIAGVIEYLYHNPDLRKQMGERGRRAVLEKYNWEKESRKLIKIYKEVLKK